MNTNNRFQGNANPNRHPAPYMAPQGYAGNQMDDEMYYGATQGNTGNQPGNQQPRPANRGGNPNNQQYYGVQGAPMDNRRGGGAAGGFVNKGPNMQGNMQPSNQYGHGQYGNAGPMPQQFGGNPAGPMRGGMRNQPPNARGGGNPMMGGAPHGGYYGHEQMNDSNMGGYQTQPNQPNQRGGGGQYNAMGGNQPRGANQQAGGQNPNQRMFNQPGVNTQGGMQQHHMQGNMGGGMNQNPNQRRQPQPQAANMDQYMQNDPGYQEMPTSNVRGNQQQQAYGAAPGPAPKGANAQGGQMRPIMPQGQGRPQPGPGGPVPAQANQMAPQQTQEAALSAQNEITMKRYNTLDRGTYFIDHANKSINFIIDGEHDLLGWHDDYLINGYLLYGIVIKVTTLTSRIYLFIEKEHEIYQNFIKVEGDSVSWKGLPNPNDVYIATVNSVEKVEIYDNSEDGFEGFVCYTVNEDSKLSFSSEAKAIHDWVALQRTFLLFEPTSIKKIFLDVLQNHLHQPESTKFQGKSVAAIINPRVPGDAVQFSITPKYVQSLDGEYFVGTIALQYGRYTLLSQTKDNMENFSRLVEKILDIAEELDGFVMITNLKRQYDSSQQQKTILILPFDPTLKIVRYDGPMNFDKTKDKLSKVITM